MTQEAVPNPLNPAEILEPAAASVNGIAQPPLPEDSAVTKAEKADGGGGLDDGGSAERPAKRLKTDHSVEHENDVVGVREVKKGVAPIKSEYLLDVGNTAASRATSDQTDARAEKDRGKKDKASGQNTNRTFGSSRDKIQLCYTRTTANEFEPVTCRFGDSCKYEHDIRRYLSEGKREDLDTLGGRCPVLESTGKCMVGWKCRFVGSHSTERDTHDGRKELVLLNRNHGDVDGQDAEEAQESPGIVNVVSAAEKMKLKKKQVSTANAEKYTQWLNDLAAWQEKGSGRSRKEREVEDTSNGVTDDAEKHENRARFRDPPFMPSEKRRIYYGPETPILAPLTTQGNLPYRRLCVELGAQVTWSEMAMGLPLIQGDKNEWALMKAHESETLPPKHLPPTPVFERYDNSRDLKFGAQIAGNKPWLALKATEVLTRYCPHLRAVDLNCGCPIDLVFRQGAGSALLDVPGKLEKILRGMNAVSGEVPVTVKIRMGTSDRKPTAGRLVERLAFGGPDAIDTNLGPAGVAAVTLHGRSRQQRYTKSADWEYISDCAALINRYNSRRDDVVDTIREPDGRTLPGGSLERMYFIGNGDCYSHEDYYNHISNAKVHSVMLARGALVKPWIFEEIDKAQHLDKSSSERLAYVEKFARYGLECWGSDEIGIGITRRFLLEWLSFACRYVPIGLLEYLPPRINDRPPAFKGRDEMETLLSSSDYRDWIKISEMFLGPAHKDFTFVPKHKSSMGYEESGRDKAGRSVVEG